MINRDTTTRKEFPSEDSANRASDEQLLERYIRTREGPLLDELVRRYERELYVYLHRYMGQREAAEDVFQQTFLSVHLRCDRFESGRRFRPWVYAIATNAAIDWKRHHGRRQMASLDRITGDGEQDRPAELGDLIGDDSAKPFDRLEEEEQRVIVREAVDALPELSRQVVLLVYYQGMKYREAADILEVPVGTVKSRLHSAIGRLSAAFTADMMQVP